MKLYNIDELVKSGLENGVFVPYDKEKNEFLNVDIQEISLSNGEVEVLSGDKREYHCLAELCSMLNRYKYVFMTKENRGIEDEKF